MDPKETEQQSIIQGITNNAARQKLRFISDVLDEGNNVVKYRPDDYKTMRGLIFDKVKTAVSKRFPIYNNKYVLSVEDLDYVDPEQVSYKDQKQAVMQGRNVGRRLRGRYVLKDTATDKVVSQTAPQTIMTVPYMTDRGTFIHSGHQYTFNNIMRLQPGVYTKKNSADQISAQFNVKKGTGAGFNMRFVPSRGLFYINRGTANAPAYTVMHDLGVQDDVMQKAWGKQLFQMNKQYGTGQKARIAANKIYNYQNK